MKQQSFLRKTDSAYGGTLMKTRQGRVGSRPLATKDSIHLVLRSSRARGSWSFKKPANEKAIKAIVDRFAQKYAVRILSLANVGNHLHFHIKLSRRQTYAPFIRAITSAIAMTVTGTSRWQPLSGRFWDYRPFTKIVRGVKAFLNLKNYILVNQLEGYGFQRPQARFFLAWQALKTDFNSS